MLRIARAMAWKCGDEKKRENRQDMGVKPSSPFPAPEWSEEDEGKCSMKPKPHATKWMCSQVRSDEKKGEIGRKGPFLSPLRVAGGRRGKVRHEAEAVSYKVNALPGV